MADNNLVQKPAEHPLTETTRNGQYQLPQVDIYETENELVLQADLPGVAPDNVDLRFEQGELILQGKVTRGQHAGNLIWNEFEPGDFFRVFQVHETIDSGRIEAECKNGVLTVRLPKAETAKPKQVAVKSA